MRYIITTYTYTYKYFIIKINLLMNLLRVSYFIKL